MPENELRSAEANRQNLEAQQRATATRLRRAELELQRQRQLIRADATAKQTLEVAEAELGAEKAGFAALAAQINEARVKVDTAKANLAYTRITAPIDGDVVAIVTQEGQTVVAAQEVPVLFKLANLDTMTVKAQVSEADVIRIRVGQAVYFTIMGDPDHRHYGTLRAIEPAPKNYAEPSNASASSSATDGGNTSTAVFYNALFDVDNSDHRLRIGMTAQVSMVLAEGKQVLTIPSAALGDKREQGGYEVRVLGANGTVETRKVRVGINNNVNAEVREGLHEGEAVITGEAAQGPGASVQPGIM